MSDGQLTNWKAQSDLEHGCLFNTTIVNFTTDI